MLSFGIEAARAFSTAFWSARFAAGSGPPSRAATMIARVNFEKSLPRFASAAPFLCLIDDHLLCPDTAASAPGAGKAGTFALFALRRAYARLLSHHVEEPLV